MMQDQRGLYIISVAARLLSMHPQTLRKYERAGLLTPNRTGGMLRLYSAEDMARLQLIKHLVETLGLNLAGVDLALELTQLIAKMQHSVETTKDPDELRKQIAQSVDQAIKVLKLDQIESPPAGATITIEF